MESQKNILSLIYTSVLFLPPFYCSKAPLKFLLPRSKRNEKKKKKSEEWYFFIKVGTLGLFKLLQTTVYPASGDP